MESVKLCNGRSMPTPGLGTWMSQPGDVTEAVKTAIDAGYRHIDCATVYKNEAEVGAGIRAKIEDGTVKREDMFITSKVWNNCHSKAVVMPALRESLDKLGLPCIDLYLMHSPLGYLEGGEFFPKDEDGKTIFSDIDYIETWLAMEECVKEGLTKSIGLSNFNRDQIERVLSIATISPVNLQVECHPYLAQKKLIAYCKSKGLVVTAYAPLGSPNRPWGKPEDPLLLEEAKLKEIGDKHGKTSAQVLLRYQVERGVVPIAKSATRKNIESNIQIFDFCLDPEDMAVIDSLDCNGRFFKFSVALDHKYYPYNAEY